MSRHTKDIRFLTIVGWGVNDEPDAVHLEAARLLAEAAELWQALGHPYDQARALHALSRALAQAGDRGGAATVCRQALGLVDMLAGQLKDGALKTSFLTSALVREI